MNYSNTQKLVNPLSGIRKLGINSGLIFGLIISTALIFFEMFNYSTTDYALRDLLGSLTFAGIRWSTTLSVAFCAIDFAGIARLFTPERGSQEPKEVWYLFGAWILAATMNAVLTWWGVSMAVSSHVIQSTTIVDPGIILKVVPIFVALMVWLIRILIIGTISVAGEHFFWNDATGKAVTRNKPSKRTTRTTTPSHNRYPNTNRTPVSASSLSKTTASSNQRSVLEPTYHNLSMSAGAGEVYSQKDSNY